MKKFYSFLFAAVALVGFAACNSDSTEEPAPAQQVGKMEFTANIGEDTKTQLGETTEGKTKVLWCKDDKITVNGVLFEIEDKENYTPATTAKFVGGEVVAPDYYAVYGTTSTAENPFNLTLTSKLGTGNIADGSNISVAYSENSTLAFKNVVTILKFEVAAACKSVKITSTAALEGNFTVTMNEGTPVVATESEDMEIELKGDFKKGIPYYTTILPGDHQFTVTIDGKPSKSAKQAMTMNRNTIYNLGSLATKSGWEISDGTTLWTTETPDLFVAKNVKLAATNFCLHKEGDTAWGAGAKYGLVTGATKKENTAIGLYSANWSHDITISNANTTAHDIYFDKANSRLYVMTVGKTPAETTAPTHTTSYNIGGAMNSWGDSLKDAEKFTYCGDNVWHLTIELAANSQFKVKTNNDWAKPNYGYNQIQDEVGKSLFNSPADGNAAAKAKGTYEIWVVPAHGDKPLYILKK